MSDRIDDALNGLSARKLREIRQLIDVRLRMCVIDGADGAEPYRIVGYRAARGGATLMLCPSCFERVRLPRSESGRDRSTGDVLPDSQLA